MQTFLLQQLYFNRLVTVQASLFHRGFMIAMTSIAGSSVLQFSNLGMHRSNFAGLLILHVAPHQENDNRRRPHCNHGFPQPVHRNPSGPQLLLTPRIRLIAAPPMQQSASR
jgi:hypothetical protein